MRDANYPEIPDSSPGRITQQIATTLAECRRLQPSQTQSTLQLVGGRVDSVANREAGIDWHGASRSTIQGVTVDGYPIGVRHTWSMSASLTGVATFNCPIGFVAQSGHAAGYPDSRHHADSASNVLHYLNCTYNAPPNGAAGVILDGGCQVTYDGLVIQGHRCGTGLHLRPRHARSVTRVQQAWLECVDGCDTFIDYDSEDSELVVSGLRFHLDRAPGVVIDMSGALRCTLRLECNHWPVVPKIRMHRSCERYLYVAPKQGFTRRQFMDAIEWVG